MASIKKLFSDDMKPYLQFLNNTGGNEPAELVGRLDKDKHISQTNAVVFTMAIAVESQMILLHRLQAAGLLKPIEEKTA